VPPPTTVIRYEEWASALPEMQRPAGTDLLEHALQDRFIAQIQATV
jgi:hypothetical protein